MGTHIPRDNRRKKIKEHDADARHHRTSFKQYLRQIEEEELADELAALDTDDQTDEVNLDD